MDVQTQTSAPRAAGTPSAKGKSPIPLLLLSALCLFFWVAASLLQIQTSEAFILHGSNTSFLPTLEVLSQPVALLSGSMPVTQAMSIIYGWGVEIIFLVCFVGYEIAHHSIKQNNAAAARWFGTAALVIILLDGISDYTYGYLASGPLGQFAFAMLASFIVATFGIIGIRLFEHAWQELSK